MIVVINHCSARAGGPDEADSWGVSGQLAGTLSGDCIRRIEYCGCGYGAEHSQVLQTHLAGAIFTNANTNMGPNTVQVSLWKDGHSLSMIYINIQISLAYNLNALRIYLTAHVAAVTTAYFT